MKGALLILIFTVATGIILYVLDRRNPKRLSEETEGAASDSTSQDADKHEASPAVIDSSSRKEAAEGECCGLHLVCEKELTAISENRILYYDDEELDRFSDREPDDYSPEEVEEFRDVLFTLLPQDIPGWARSLDRRGIRPPQEVRDELMILLQEV